MLPHLLVGHLVIRLTWEVLALQWFSLTSSRLHVHLFFPTRIRVLKDTGMTKLELPTPVLICQGLTCQGQWPARCWIQWSVLSRNHLDPSAAFDSADRAQSEHTLLPSPSRCLGHAVLLLRPLCAVRTQGAPSCASASAPCVITSWLPVPRHPLRASSASPLGHRTAVSGRVCPRASFGCFSPNPHLSPVSLSGQPLPPGTRDRSQTLWSHPSLLSSSYLCPRHREIPWLLMWTHTRATLLRLSLPGLPGRSSIASGLDFYSGLTLAFLSTCVTHSSLLPREPA